jgi:hypothetical protein
MMCFAAAALGLLGIAAMRRARHCGHGYHGYGWQPPFGRGDHDGWRGRGERMMLHAVFRRIDASPAQERAIVAEVEKLSGRVHAAKAGVKDARGDLAAALRGPVLDDAALGAVLGRVDAATGEARSAVIDALRGIHGLLDDKQRAQVADLLDHGGGWWGGGFGPYR